MHAFRPRSAAASRLPQRSFGASGTATIAVALALLTGLALGQLTLLGGRSFEQRPGRPAEAMRIGLEFYDAIGVYFATGQASGLRALMHPDFVDHRGSQPAARGTEAFLRALDAVRPFVTGDGLSATPTMSSGSLAHFSVALPGASATIFGLPLAETRDLQNTEILRIDDGRIVERWSDFSAPAVLTPLASIVWDPPPASQMAPAIERVTMLHGSRMTLKHGTAHVVLVESGSLTIIEAPRGASNPPEFPPDRAAIAEAKALVALPGSAVFAAGSSPYTLVNDGPAVARALLIRISGYALSSGSSASGAFGTSKNDGGVQIETLAASPVLDNRNGDWTIEIGRATLAAGTAIPRHNVEGSQLLVVEQGTLDATLGACKSRCARTIAGAGTLAGERHTLQAGHGISVSEGATAAYRATAAPVTVLIVTVAPEQG